MKVDIIRERRKSLKAYVHEQKIIIKAPLFVSDKVIQSFLQTHQEALMQWIEREREAMERLYLFGRAYLVRKELDEGYLFDGEFFWCGEDVQKHKEAFWKERAREYLPQKAKALAKSFGVRFLRVKISAAKRRWGSCSAKGSINLAFRLMQLPQDVIEYVIIHELCHLTHMNHSKDFWKLVQRRCPDFKEREKRLKHLSSLL